MDENDIDVISVSRPATAASVRKGAAVEIGVEVLEGIRLANDRKAIVDELLHIFKWTLWGLLLGGLGLLLAITLNPAAAPVVVPIFEKTLKAVGELNAQIFSPFLGVMLGWYFGSKSAR